MPRIVNGTTITAHFLAKFMVEDAPNVLHEGYTTTDDYHWICEPCFEDFREQFKWTVRDDGNPQT